MYNPIETTGWDRRFFNDLDKIKKKKRKEESCALLATGRGTGIMIGYRRLQFKTQRVSPNETLNDLIVYLISSFGIYEGSVWRGAAPLAKLTEWMEKIRHIIFSFYSSTGSFHGAISGRTGAKPKWGGGRDT